MLYPVYVHVGDQTHAHGIIIPDLPGCVSAADSWEELPAAIQKAAERYFEQTGMRVPDPTPLEKLALDPNYRGGVWMLVEIDVSSLHAPSRASSNGELNSVLSSKVPPPFINETVEKFARREWAPPQPEPEPSLPEPAQVEPEQLKKVELALPEELLKVIDEFAEVHDLNRSAVIARAAMKLVADKKE